MKEKKKIKSFPRVAGSFFAFLHLDGDIVGAVLLKFA